MKRIALAIVIVMIAGNAWAIDRNYGIISEYSWATDTDNMISSVKKAGFNVLMINVTQGYGVRWNSSLPMDTTLGNVDLNQFVLKAKVSGLKVWFIFCVSLRSQWSYWANNWPYIAQDAYDLRDESYRKYVLDSVSEALRFNPDGIVLDYIRMGVDGIPEQDQIVESYVSNIHNIVKEYDPKILLSAYGHDEDWQGRRAYHWLNLGLIDVWLARTYEQNVTTSRIAEIASKTTKPNQIMFLVQNYDPNPSSGYAVMNRLRGIGDYPMKGIYVSEYLTVDQINTLRWGWWK